MLKGLFIGRFQPFHFGHLSAVKQAFRKVDFLTIGIGSAQESGTRRNPFTSKERADMITQALSENGISAEKFRIVPVPDIHDNPKWPAHVRALAPGFNMIFVGNDGIVKQLFKKYDNVRIVKVNEEIKICATEIREAMKNKGDWKKYIPLSVADYIEKIGVQPFSISPRPAIR